MQNFLRIFLLLALTVTTATTVSAQIGTIDVRANNKVILVRVSSPSAELNDLAQRAFGAHGLYKVTAGSVYAYDIRFTSVGATQVRVDISKGTAPFASSTVTGTSARNALLRAADFAVEKTNGIGLKGFFTARLASIGTRTGKPEIYTSDLFFGEVKQITHDNAFALMPRWSPDGSKLLYTSFFKSGAPDIFQIDLRSSQRTTFVSFRGTNSSARYSPNGQQVAMVLSGEGTPEIYISNAQGRQVSRKTRSDAVKSSPCFSPDGSRVVFAMEPGPQLYVMSTAGGPVSRVSSGFTYCAEPDWSRTNPNKIAFTVMQGRNFQIAVLDLSTRQSQKVSKAPFDGVEPSWLADGRHLVYTARTASTSRICILDTETGTSVPISPTSLGQMQSANVWTP
ncbi:MAG: PD40 domain-containing protein [Verrucomicrobia bacterium]|nr:PD40 domain-containing protein [Verrucomicrobiota bacterium]